MKNKVSTENLNKLHAVQVEILDEIVKICKKNNLNYFLIGGTLLGAVRHQGFIPWDDDLDVAMPRKDYERFISICKSELSNKYYLQHISTDKKYWQNFAKIRKNNTLFDEKMVENIETHKGIFVDIFPLDNLKKINIFFKAKWSIIKNLEEFALYYRGIKNKEEINHFLFCKIFSVFGLKNILKFCDFFLKTQTNKETEFLVSYAGTYSRGKEVYKREWFFPARKIEFENKKYSCPNNNDAILSQVYGDYMTLPPVENRVTHLPKKIIFDLKEDKDE